MEEKVKISVIISVLNGEKTLQKCLDSIIDQDFQNKELIIIDGGSTDNTLQILNKYSNFINYWISEKDSGIYNAWNKAILKATGDWYCFIGSDDILVKGSLSKISKLANFPTVNFICSRVIMIDENGQEMGSIGKAWNFKKFAFGLGIVHCGALHHKSLFDFDKFNEQYKIASDFEFLIRVGKWIKPTFLNEITVKMSNTGMSRRNINKVIGETSHILSKSIEFGRFHGINYFILAHTKNVLRKIIFIFPFGRKLFSIKNSLKN